MPKRYTNRNSLSLFRSTSCKMEETILKPYHIISHVIKYHRNTRRRYYCHKIIAEHVYSFYDQMICWFMPGVYLCRSLNTHFIFHLEAYQGLHLGFMISHVIKQNELELAFNDF